MKRLRNMIAKSELEKAKKALENGQVIAFPTETVMGLGVSFDNYNAYSLLNKIKRRPEDKPYTMMLGDVNDVSKYAHLTHRDLCFIHKFMPGPITVLLNAKDIVPNYVTHNSGIIGIRVSDFKEVCELINYYGKPLLVPSANRSNEKPCNTYKEVESVFKNEISYLLKKDGGKNKPSTIIDLTTNNIKILREGDITLDQIKRRMKMKTISIGSDHGGFDYKEAVKQHLEQSGYKVIDVGTYSKDSCHYPVFGAEAAKKVANHEADFGIVICTSGEGIMMAANKIKGVRCGLGYNDDVTRLSRQHNDANMIAFGQKFMSLEDVIRRVDIFLNTEFEGGRHQTRVEIIDNL